MAGLSIVLVVAGAPPSAQALDSTASASGPIGPSNSESNPGPEVEGVQQAAAVQVAATNSQWTTLELSWAGGTTTAEPAGWQNPGFDDSGWSAAYIPTDPYQSWVDIAGADWLSSTGRATGHLTSEIWIARYEFAIEGMPDGDGTLTWNVDNYASIWINGEALVTTSGNWTNVFTTSVPAATLHAGTNSIGVKVYQDANTNSWEVNPTFFQATLGVSVTAGPPVEQTYGAGSGLHGPRTTHHEAEPVDTATGNYVSEVTDLALPGRGLPFAFTRTYNSLDAGVGSLGPGWRQSFGAALVIEASGSARFIAEDGAQYVFGVDGAGGFAPPAGSTDRLTTTPTGYELQRRDQVRYEFDSSGRLVAEMDRNGNTLSFGYSGANLTSITDTVGRLIGLGYDPAGHLTSLADPAGRTVGYAYDAVGRLTTVTDVRGGTTTYAYDAGGRLATITDQNGHVLVTNMYGPDGRVAEQLDARGFAATFAWDPATQTSTFTDARGGIWVDAYVSNRLVARTNPLGETTTYGYDPRFNRTSVTDPRGNTTTFAYDAAGNLLSRTAPAPFGYVETFTYSGANNLLTATNGRGHSTTNTYDAAGNLLTTTGPTPTSPVTTFTYDPAGSGLVTAVTDPRGKTTTFAYDTQGNRIRTTSPLGEITSMAYDATGRMTSLVEPRGNVAGANPADYTTTFTYDAAGNILAATDPLGNVTTTTYDPVGLRSIVTDAKAHATTYGYDAADHLTTVTDALGGVTTYAYDATANLTGRTDAKTHVTAYDYDLAGRLTRTTDPLLHTWTLTYDPAGNVATRTDANAKTTTYRNDALNRLTGITYAPGTTSPVTFAYDADGNRTSLTDGAGTETYTYDSLDRLTGVTRGSDAFGYAYDAAANMTSRTYPDGTITSYAYDDDGRMASATSAGKTTTYGYDPAGNVLTTLTPDGFTALSTYDRAGRLREVAHLSSAGLLSRATYTLDQVGNRTQVTTTRGTMLYAYDALDRLTQVCYGTCPGGGGGGGPTGPEGAIAIAPSCLACATADSVINTPPSNNPPAPGDTFTRWSYDAVGNRASETTYLGVKTYAYDAADRLTSTSGPGSASVAYGYDNNGNQLSSGATTYAYDLADRLVRATVGSTTETYTWSGDGIRLTAATGTQAAKIVRFVVDRMEGLGSVAIERDGANKTLRRYVYGLDLLSQTTPTKGPYWYHHDGLGSVTDVTSGTGASLWWTEYTPYGAPRASAATSQAPVNLFRFTGEYLDNSTSLYHLRARQYDPTTGRFLSTDPATPGVGDPYVSAYIYANDTPVRYADPSGRCIGPLIFLAPACIGAAIGFGSYVVTTVVTNVAGNVVEGRDPLHDPGRGLNPLDAGLSAAAGVLGGPLGGLSYGPTRVLAGVALGCAATFASQAAGQRSGDLVETGIGCLAGGAGSIWVFNSKIASAIYGTIVALAQAIGTYVEQRVGNGRPEPSGK